MNNLGPKCANSFYGRRYVNIESALQDIDESSENVDLVIIPPNPSVESDCDEIDEDDINSTLYPNDVPGEVEVFVNDDHFDSDDEIPISVLYDHTFSVTENEIKFFFYWYIAS